MQLNISFLGDTKHYKILLTAYIAILNAFPIK